MESVGACKERRGLSRKELEEVSYHSNYDPAAYKKINTMWYRETHDQIRESLSVDLNPNRALNLVKSMKQYEEYRRVCGSRILCLDGGGIRGLLQMTILMEIEKLTGRKIVDLFDWIVGTSTGGIIALALTYGEYIEITGSEIPHFHILFLLNIQLQMVWLLSTGQYTYFIPIHTF